ncbi:MULTISPECIES: carboxylating nicotinate-nucleotide diphosphorylase [unclassified Exiguobacterium]|uniref:carboxylating nicotinate-nucleotide diphosphorylase n=1 Tax=unclassified Exiguobacterium TaxID=2644629 RepID=UPI001BE66FB1|nr:MULTISPECIES: carboxylating nicotinate-nucleotide diphosphorylase [unclassified Exiguobacterium]
MNRWHLQQQLEGFLIEDIGHQDITSELCLTGHEQGTGRFLAKEDGIFCGVAVLRELARLLEVTFIQQVEDGQAIKRGQVLAEWTGDLRSILSGERVALNLIQRTSGIATLTRSAVDRADGRIRIADTRKTTPGLRMLEKHAVRVGGGFNHRGRLDDAVMIKDNHITAAGSITEAVKRAKRAVGHTTPIEVEVETESEVDEAVKAGVDIIMLDNRTPAEIKQLRQLIPSHITVEISGGITVETLPDYADSGANVISVGALTHSAPALDISMKIQGGKKDEL